MSALTDFKSYSQAGQDRFVYELLGPDHKGTFLDIGCSHPAQINNTYALELNGWQGLLVDLDDVTELCGQFRQSEFRKEDATKMVHIRKEYDYGSFDIDGATYDALQNAIHQDVKFRVLTVEHDSYRIGVEMRDKIRKLLKLSGYTMLCEDVCHEGHPFEDWWVDWERVDDFSAIQFKCVGKEGKDIRRVYTSAINSHFDRVFVINLDRRADRWDHAKSEMQKLHLIAERFSAYDSPINDGKPNGNMGCTASHRALLEIIAYNKWKRVLVLEDDFLTLYDDVPERLDAMLPEVPKDWDLIYLGGHYAEKPISRVSPHVIRCAGMLTTSSYVITWQAARRMAPYISGIGPIDNLFSMFARTQKHYILQPRLFAQYTSKSDLCGETRDNVPCMTDTRHENMV